MDDLISRQAAIDALAKFVPYAICDESTESYTNGLKDAYNLICQLPSAQPDIIRCKDCKYYKAHDYTGYLACHLVLGVKVRRDPDDFCSRGERM